MVHAQDSTKEDKENVGGGYCPDGPATDLSTEDTYAEHGEKVVESEDGVGETAGEAGAGIDGVGVGGVGKKEEG